MSVNRRGTLFVVSAPSGAGKTTLCRELRKRVPGLAYSISVNAMRRFYRESSLCVRTVTPPSGRPPAIRAARMQACVHMLSCTSLATRSRL